MTRANEYKVGIILGVVAIFWGACFEGIAQDRSITNAPVVLEAFPATYPPAALEMDAKGIVLVRISIKPDGTVASTEVLAGPKPLHKVTKAACGAMDF